MNTRNDPHQERLQVATLKELDALVGTYLTHETPHVFWEEQQVCLRFDTIEEALEAMRDPYFQQFIPDDARAHSLLTEVQEFRPYSSDLTLAWEVVQRLNDNADAFYVRREYGQWVVGFGQRPASISHSAPVAICLAALLARGIDVELATEWGLSGAEQRAVA